MSNTIDAVDPMVMTLRSAVVSLLGDDTRFRFEICVTEALTNIVIHAGTTDRDAPIQIELETTNGRALIKIFDPIGAAPFDLRTASKDLSEVDAMAESGRGLGLILECANDVTYGASGTRNGLSLAFWDNDKNNIQPFIGASK